MTTKQIETAAKVLVTAKGISIEEATAEVLATIQAEADAAAEEAERLAIEKATAEVLATIQAEAERLAIEKSMEASSPKGIRLPNQVTVAAQVVGWKEVQGAGKKQKDSVFLDVTTLEANPRTLTIFIDNEMIVDSNTGVSLRDTLLYDDNYVSLLLDEAIAGVTYYVAKGSTDKTVHEQGGLRYVKAVNATDVQVANGLANVPAFLAQTIFTSFKAAREAHKNAGHKPLTPVTSMGLYGG